MVTCFDFKCRRIVVTLSLVAASIAWQSTVAQDLAHDISGIVKKVDKATKTMVIKADDGTEHTKWTDKTTEEGAKDAGKGVEKGSADSYLAAKKGARITVHYTEKGSEKTAVAVKDAVD